MATTGVRFDATAARDAAFRLDGLADRLENDLKDGVQTLHVAPSGIDEVSLRAAQTMNDVAGSYTDSATAGVHELRKLAATLRAQADSFGRAETESAEALGGTEAV
ncbi:MULTISPECIES: PE family protein [Nocardia]|uniref:PE domain-containing protein n=1 Tax=Nocardia arthritidis TaxID=228602 RepID=A0A6G9Y7H2_9NOCA|nr:MULTISPECIES: PE family protein [Nocardia]QIS09003.1 PE domain-containing protein [Nocardia arthritidis]